MGVNIVNSVGMRVCVCVRMFEEAGFRTVLTLGVEVKIGFVVLN